MAASVESRVSLHKRQCACQACIAQDAYKVKEDPGTWKTITLRRVSTCAICSKQIDRGMEAFWNPSTKQRIHTNVCTP